MWLLLVVTGRLVGGGHSALKGCTALPKKGEHRTKYGEDNILQPSYFSWTLVASSYSGQNQSTACFECWPKCAHWGIFDCFFTVILTILNNTRQCFYRSKTVDSFLPVNVLTTRKVWQCSTFKCTRYALASMLTFWLLLTLIWIRQWRLVRPVPWIVTA